MDTNADKKRVKIFANLKYHFSLSTPIEMKLLPNLALPFN